MKIMEKITFFNTCSVPEWMPEHKKEFRRNANSYFEKIMSSVSLFEGKEVTISYFQEGVGSVVAKITLSSGEIYVIKTTETTNRTVAEIKAYEAMSKHNVKVPKVYAEGVIDEYPFLVMEYFGEGTLQDALNEKKKTVDEVGKIKSEAFVNLQSIPGKGYGWPIENEGEFLIGNFSDIGSFIEEWFCKKEMIEVAKKYEPSVSWNRELKTNSDIIRKENPGDKSHLGSFDFQTAHFFATEPPTLFDPNPRLEPEYFDLAYLLVPSVDSTDNNFKLNKLIVSKFETSVGSIDKEKLLRALWLQTFRKATNLLLRSNEKRTRRGLYMLKILSNKDGLEEYMNRYLFTTSFSKDKQEKLL